MKNFFTKTLIPYYKAGLFVLLFVVEYLTLTHCTIKDIFVITFVLSGINLCFFSIHILTKKIEHFRSFFFKIFKNIAGNILGIVAIVYFTTHIGWIFTALRESYTVEDGEQSFYQFWFYLSFLFFPYLVLTFFIKRKSLRVQNSDRKVFLSSVSLLDASRYDKEKMIKLIEKSEEDIDLTKLILPEKKYLLTIRDKHYNNWGRINWKPLFDAIEQFENLEEINLFLTKEVVYLENLISNDESDSDFYGVVEMINKYFPNIKIITHQLENPNNIQISINDINNVIRKRKQKYSDRDFVFSITSATAVVSAAMAMIAIKGERGIVYKDQTTMQTVNNPVNVFDIKELWEEIIDQYE